MTTSEVMVKMCANLDTKYIEWTKLNLIFESSAGDIIRTASFHSKKHRLAVVRMRAQCSRNMYFHLQLALMVDDKNNLFSKVLHV